MNSIITLIVSITASLITGLSLSMCGQPSNDAFECEQLTNAEQFEGEGCVDKD